MKFNFLRLEKIKKIIPLFLLLIASIGVYFYKADIFNLFSLEENNWFYSNSSELIISFIVFFFVLFFLKFMNVFVWYGIIKKRINKNPPKLLIDMWATIIWFVGAFFVYAFVFENSVTGLIATSSVLVAVIGFALKNIISDIFSGIAINLDHAFEIGDWISIDETNTGEIVEMTWLTTRIRTLDNVYFVIPNSKISSTGAKNYGSNKAIFRDKLEISFDYDITGWRAERILLGAVKQVEETSKISKSPEVRIKDFSENGVVWELLFWIKDYKNRYKIRYKVQRAILRNLHFAGIHVSHQKHIVYNPNTPNYISNNKLSLREILTKIDIFKALDDDDIVLIARKAKRHLVLFGEPVVKQGQEGGSIFLVGEGLLSVFSSSSYNNVPIGHLLPGDYFGEMSLLTGEKRNATVVPDVDSIVYEIDKETIETIIKRRKELADNFAEILATREITNKRIFDDESNQDGFYEKDKIKTDLVDKIKGFFKFG